MRQIAIYGKGGIGKSTIAANLSMALKEMGLRVMQVGCDPKRDSTRILAGGRLIPTVLETFREELRIGKDEYAISLKDIIFQAQSGIYCVESGGPEPGIGCAGRGVLTALQILSDLKAFETYGIDVAIYDVLGDVVCGGFAMPIRHGYAQEIYLICSGGFMSIYAANNIAKAIRRLSRRGETGLAGVICNSSGDEQFEKVVLSQFAEALGSKLVHLVPRSPVIQACEVESRTVLEHSPQSEEAEVFRELARQVMDNDRPVIPKPIEEISDLEAMYREHLPK
ncbi:MAG: AAA family ATPase [Dehalococcoidia bacterium]|jgi:nitrogenase iron protein NifH|nr:AAA family ATPase [Chloroflexota bacterium]MCK4242988.1 AAA family ATPase [Dehalococcoidia bacterium]